MNKGKMRRDLIHNKVQAAQLLPVEKHHDGKPPGHGRPGGVRATLVASPLSKKMLSQIGSVLPSGLREFSQASSPTIDVDVLLSYYAHFNEHRPSSRLLKERHSKGSRSAKLLVPGSPAFERPWR